MPSADSRHISAVTVRTVAYAALLLGALDPLEGSWLVAAAAGILAIAGRG